MLHPLEFGLQFSGTPTQKILIGHSGDKIPHDLRMAVRGDVFLGHAP
jgi:hypothetical protein